MKERVTDLMGRVEALEGPKKALPVEDALPRLMGYLVVYDPKIATDWLHVFGVTNDRYGTPPRLSFPVDYLVQGVKQAEIGFKIEKIAVKNEDVYMRLKDKYG